MSETLPDSYYEAIEKVVYPAIEQAFRFTDCDQDLFEAEDQARQRKSSVFDVLFDFGVERYVNETPGPLSIDGVPGLSADGAQKRADERCASSLVKHGSVDSMRGLVRQGRHGHVVLHEEVAAISTLRCNPCAGGGSVTCSSCSGAGDKHCYSCSLGENMCLACSGAGYIIGVASPGQRTPRIQCHNCWGRGRSTCFHCRGTSRLTCSGCGGHGAVQCGSCCGHGFSSRAHGFRVVVDTAIKAVSSRFDPEMRDRVKRWLEKGLPGMAKKVSDPLLPFADIETAPVEKVAEAKGIARKMTVTCVSTVHVINCRFEEKPVKVTYWNLGGHEVRIDPFLDRHVTLAAQKLEDAGAVSPEEFRKALEGYPGLVEAIAVAWKNDPLGKGFAELVEAESHGAVSKLAASPVGTSYNRCIDGFARRTVKKSFVLPLAATLAIWLAGQALGVQQFVHFQQSLLLVLAYGIVPAALVAAISKFSASRKLLKATGHKGKIAFGKEMLEMPTFAAVMLAVSAYWNIVVLP